MESKLTDTELVRLVRDGDNSAFDFLVLRHQHKIARLVMRYVPDVDQALDIAQEAFLKAYRGLSKFRGESSFYTWLYRITANTAMNYLLAQRRRPHGVFLDPQHPELCDASASLKEMNTPEDQALSREFVNTVEGLIENLPRTLRMTMILRQRYAMSYEDIAQSMECPIGTVRARIFRARVAIGKQIGIRARRDSSGKRTTVDRDKRPTPLPARDAADLGESGYSEKE